MKEYIILTDNKTGEKEAHKVNKFDFGYIDYKNQPPVSTSYANFYTACCCHITKINNKHKGQIIYKVRTKKCPFKILTTPARIVQTEKLLISKIKAEHISLCPKCFPNIENEK